jgi:hypothetical protein
VQLALLLRGPRPAALRARRNPIHTQPAPVELSLADGLEALAAQAQASDAPELAKEARALRERVVEGRFFVACLGQFKRGKSTLINALLGQPLLPAGVPPVTSVVTVVRHGPLGARVRLGAQLWRAVPVENLADFVSEHSNPENRLGVQGVEVYCPSPFLEQGLCLVDTPGVGSIFLGNTSETRAFVPQVDAAIVVLGGDPPISQDELQLVSELTPRVSDLFIVLNKADKLSPPELAEARAFTEQVLRDRAPAAKATVFEVSALEQLLHGGPAREWPQLVAAVHTLAQESGRALVDRAAARGLGALLDRLARRLEEDRGALLRPVEETARRLTLLRRCEQDAQRSLFQLTHLFDAEQQHLARLFGEARGRFIEATLPEVLRALDERLAAEPARRGGALYRQLVDDAQVVVERAIQAWRAEQQPRAARDFAEVTERLVAHANAFLSRLRETGQVPEDALPLDVVAEAGLHARTRFSFASLMRQASRSRRDTLLEPFRSKARSREVVRQAAVAFATLLLDVNANRLGTDLDERVTESRRGVEGALHRALHDVVRVAEDASRRADVARGQGAQAVADAVSHCEAHLEALRRLRARVGLS